MSTELGKPTLHHLNNSQSQRILWLLEELEIPYDLKLYKRIASGPEKLRAPPELKQIHPSGKSPLLTTASGRVIAESSAIALYLINTYDTAGRFKHDDYVRDEEISSVAGTSIGGVGIVKILLDFIVSSTPSLARPLSKMMTNGINNAFAVPEFKKNLAWLESQLTADFFMGDRLGRADFIMVFPIDMMFQRKWVDLTEFPKIKAWRERVLARPAWKRGLEKGNGYNLAEF